MPTAPKRVGFGDSDPRPAVRHPLDPLAEQVDRPGGERDELPHRRDAARDQVAAAGEEHHGDGDPHPGSHAEGARPQHAGGVAAGPGQTAEPVVAPADLAPEELAEPGAPPRHEAPDLGVGDAAELLHLLPRAPQLVEAAQVPQPGPGDVPGLARPPDEERVHDLGDVEHHRLRHGDSQADGRVRAQQDAQAVAGLQPAPVVDGAAHAEGLEVTDLGVGGDDDAGTGDVGAPAEAHVVEEVVDALVEPADLGEEVGSHEGAGAGDGEHVLDGVVLLLVELAALDEGHGVARVVDALADLEEPVRGRPSGPAWARRWRRWSGRPPRRGAARRPGGGHVVVAHEVEGRPVDDVEHVVGGRPEAGVGLDPAHEGPRRGSGHPGLHLVGAGGVDHQDRQVRVVLVGQGSDGLLEPVPGVVRDDDGHHSRGHRASDPASALGSSGLGLQGWANVLRWTLVHSFTSACNSLQERVTDRPVRPTMARLQLDDVTNAVKDAAYVSVGLGVIAFQRLQVRRNELEARASGSPYVGATVGDRVKVVEERVSATFDRSR